MMPMQAARLMSFADVQHRQDELTREFADIRRGRARKSARRAARHTRTATPVTSTATAVRRSRTSTPAASPRMVPTQHRTPATAAPTPPASPATVPGSTLPGVPTSSTTVLTDDRLPVG